MFVRLPRTGSSVKRSIEHRLPRLLARQREVLPAWFLWWIAPLVLLSGIVVAYNTRHGLPLPAVVVSGAVILPFVLMAIRSFLMWYPTAKLKQSFEGLPAQYRHEVCSVLEQAGGMMNADVMVAAINDYHTRKSMALKQCQELEENTAPAPATTSRPPRL